MTNLGPGEVHVFDHYVPLPYIALEGRRPHQERTLKMFRPPKPNQRPGSDVQPRERLLEPCPHDDHAILGAQRDREDTRRPWEPGGPQAPGPAEVLPEPFRTLFGPHFAPKRPEIDPKHLFGALQGPFGPRLGARTWARSPGSGARTSAGPAP